MASFPLPALSIHPPQSPDPSEALQRILMMRNLVNQGQLQQQEIQGAGLENQVRQRQIQSAQALQSLFPKFVQKDDNGKPTGYDYDGLMSAAGAAGVDPATLEHLQTMRASAASTALTMANTQGKSLENQQKLNDRSFQHLEGIRGVNDPAKRQELWQSALQWGTSQGQDISHLPPQAPDDTGLSQIEARLGMHAQALADNKAQSELQQTQAKTEESKSTTQKTNAELAYYQQHGGAPGVPLDTQEANTWMDKNPGKNLADFMKYKATLVPQFNFNLMNSTGQGQAAADVAKKFGMSPVAFDQAAEKYWTTGQLPPAGRGGPALAMNKAIQNRAADLHPEGSLAANSAEYDANKASLSKLQTQYDAVTAFEGTAEKNIDRLLTTAKSIPDLGAKFANIPVRAISGTMIGTENMARFKADLATAQNEAAKVLNSANASGVLSDTARKELQDLADGNLSYKALSGAFAELKNDMGNRKQSYSDQIADIQRRLGGKSATNGGGKEIHYKVVNGQLVQQ